MFVLYIISFYAFIVFTKSDTVISTHASAREATPNGTFPIATSKFQSTLPRGKRRLSAFSLSFFFLISIHASAREATSKSIPFSMPCKISIHASAREATMMHKDAGKPTNYFNPRFRKGSDTLRLIDLHPSADFNPRFRKGSDILDKLEFIT